MSVDRKNGPEIKKVTSLDIPPVQREILANGIELVTVNMGTQNLVQLEVMFKGGRICETKKGASRATARLLKEGTKSYTGHEIAEIVDFYGANISTGASLDYSYAKIFSLNKHFHKVLPILEEVIYHPVFPEKELDKYKETSRAKLKVEMAKSELVAYKLITEKIFGTDHIYGYNSTDSVYQHIQREDLLQYYSDAYATDNCMVVLSGKVTDDIKGAVVNLFSKVRHKTVGLGYEEPTNSAIDKKLQVKTEDNLQSAIKIGKRLFKRDHPDFADLFILNTVLGGYFGSRLMSSLREDKGYTYNIYSSVDMMMYDGYFNVSTEVGNEYVSKTIEGIYEEMDILKANRIGSGELDMVKNYLSGNFLNMIDGPFKVAGMSKVVCLNGLDFSFYQNLMGRIHTITADELQHTAKKYLNREDMYEIIVGNP